jgi:hypothetical protein
MPITSLDRVCGVYTKTGGYMEERNKLKARSANDDVQDIVELTPDMEVPDQSAIQIIDLTDALDGPEPGRTLDPAPSVSGAQQSASAVPIEEAQTAAPPVQSESISDIELEVDAAFDAVQAPIEDEPKTVANEFEAVDSDALLDRLSGIPARVDAALEAQQNAVRPQTEEAQMVADAAVDTQAIDAEALSADAAELEEAMSGHLHEASEDEVIELNERVDSVQTGSDDFLEQEEDIIELTDIVDPAELRVPAASDTIDDDEIIELTDIVGPAELSRAEAGWPEDDEVLELTEVVEPAEMHVPLMDHEPPAREAAQVRADEDTLAPEPMTYGAESLEPIEIGAIPDLEEEPLTEENIIRLSDVLDHQGRDIEPIPIEQIKMGAEETLATQHISLEAEDTAEALGLDLEQGRQEEEITLTDSQIEAAVERIIQKKYAATIEQLVAQAVEKAVAREIETIKRAMLDGDEPAT